MPSITNNSNTKAYIIIEGKEIPIGPFQSIQYELKHEDPKVYRGAKLKYKDGTTYLLACPEVGKLALINLTTGNRWSDAKFTAQRDENNYGAYYVLLSEINRFRNFELVENGKND